MKIKIPDKQLDALIEEATVDCYEDSECQSGFEVMLQDNITYPFTASVIGETVKITGVISDGAHITAVCVRNGKKYSVDILDIEYDPKNVTGYEWIEAYRSWSGHR